MYRFGVGGKQKERDLKWLMCLTLFVVCAL